MMCRKLEMLPIECIVRGYITGSGWASYQENGTVCGIKLPEGLKESDKLPEPIYTPSTKAEIGDHDENISYEQSIDHLEKYFPGKGQEYAEKLRDYTIALYKKCADYALTRVSSLLIQNLNSVLMRTVTWYLVTRCSHQTAPVSGQQMDMSRVMDSRPSTNSSPVTG